MATRSLAGFAIELGGCSVPCATVTLTSEGADDRWTVRACDVPTDVLRPLRSAIGPRVDEFALRLTDFTGTTHEGRGHLRRTVADELGYRLVFDDLVLSFEGHID